MIEILFEILLLTQPLFIRLLPGHRAGNPSVAVKFTGIRERQRTRIMSKYQFGGSWVLN